MVAGADGLAAAVSAKYQAALLAFKLWPAWQLACPITG